MFDTIESEVIGLSCIEKRYADHMLRKRFSNKWHIFLTAIVFIGLLPPTNSVVPAALTNPNLGGTYQL